MKRIKTKLGIQIWKDLLQMLKIGVLLMLERQI